MQLTTYKCEFWPKKSGFQGQKHWPPKFHIKFRNPGPLPYLGNFPKFYQFFWCLPYMNVIRSGQKGPREIPTNKISSANLAPSDPTTSVAFSPASPVLPAGSPPLLPGSSCLPDGSWSPPLVDNRRAGGRGMIELERDADGHRRANICTHNICHSP